MDDDYFDGLIEMPLLRGFRPKFNRSKFRTLEDCMQAQCVQWFRQRFPELSDLLFSVPNAAHRNPREAGRLKSEGWTAGVSDLVLLIPTKSSHGLCIEIKRPEGQSSEAQKKWGRKVREYGYDYLICRSVEAFKQATEQRVKDMAI